MWTKIGFTRASDESASTHLGLAHAGIDYRVNPNVVVGLMGQYDDTEEDGTNGAGGFSVSGQGFLVGPYGVVRFGGVTVEGRAAFGRSSNEVSPYGTYTDEVDATRQLYRVGVSGRAELTDRISLVPSAVLVHFSEESDAYTDSLGVAIAAQEANVGRLTFGPTLEATLGASDELRLTFGAEGLWDFDTTGRVDLVSGRVASGDDELRMRLNAGASVRVGQGELGINGFYDGIGADDFEAYGGSASFKLRF